MDNKAESENFRGISIAALITGILTWTIGFMMSEYPVTYVHISQLIADISLFSTAEYINLTFISIAFGIGLPISALVCGGVDLSRIQAGVLSSKGRGFDITGIVLGSVYLIVRVFEEFGLAQVTFGDFMGITFG